MLKVQIIRHGKFKAATEPLFLDKMSPENRDQITALISDVWDESPALHFRIPGNQQSRPEHHGRRPRRPDR
ncbi:MAG: hypothetical protein MZV63_46325 [Marinilabiliales bacterium]|nr:hypothetical protein [Marinilabiliales bacterium]